MASDARGMALVVVLLAILLLSTAAAALLALATTERLIAANHRLAIEASYAAETAIAHAVSELDPGADLGAMFGGLAHGSLWDSGSGAQRTLADGALLNLDHVRNQANCGTDASCAPGDLATDVTGARSWGARNPVWEVYERGWLRDLSAATRDSPFYVVVLVADDPLETDGDPLRDAPAAADAQDVAHPGAGLLLFRGEAFGPRGAHAVVETTVKVRGLPAGESAPRVLAWRRPALSP